jgi:hypothetical protein
MGRRVAWLWLLLAVAGAPLHAQRRVTVGVHGTLSPQLPCAERLACEAFSATPIQAPASGSAWAIAWSAVLPGSGQALLGVDRALPYLAVEAFAWTEHAKASRDYRRRRNGYRDLASRVARAPFAAFRPNGDFEYYERMTHYRETGRYDVVVGGGLEPETDSTTYNGAMWLLARRTYWSNPDTAPDTTSAEWQRAISFYRARAYDQPYRWSWTNAPAEYAMFLDLIRESNDANRRAMQHLGLIIANHVLSTVDAFITVRLQGQGRGRMLGVEGSIPFSGFGFAKNAPKR